MLESKALNDESLRMDINTERQIALDNCTFVKSVLMLIIVFYHSILFWNGTWFVTEPIIHSQLLPILARWLNSFHIYAFTFVSGYLYYYLKHEAGKYKEFVPFIKQKAKRLIVPYFFVTAVWVVPITWYFFDLDFTSIVQKYILGVSPSQLWFLLMLFNVFVIFGLFSGIIKEHTVFGMLVACVLWGISVVGQQFIENYFQIWNTLSHFFSFGLGLSSDIFREKLKSM